MKRRQLPMFLLIIAAGTVWARDIDAEILKDLDFFAEMDVLETEAMLETVRVGGSGSGARTNLIKTNQEPAAPQGGSR